MNPILNGRSSLIALVLAWAYFPTLGDLWHKWMNDPQYSHGVLVPFFCAYLVWQRRERTDRFSRPALVSGFVLLGIGVACRIYSAGLLFLSLDGFSILPTLAGIALILGGWSLVKWVWPGLLFLVFMVPLPYTAERMMGAELQKVATLASTWLLQCFGQPAIAEGNTIQRRDFTNNFPAGVCILNIGCSRFCPGEGDNAADRACTDIDIDGDGEIDKL